MKLKSSYRSLDKIRQWVNNAVIVKFHSLLFSTSLNSQIWKLFPASASAWECPKWNCWAQTSMRTFNRLRYFICKLFTFFFDPWKSRKQLLLTCFGTICTGDKHQFYSCGGRKLCQTLNICKGRYEIDLGRQMSHVICMSVLNSNDKQNGHLSRKLTLA